MNNRYSVQEKILRNRNEEDRYSIRSTNKLNANEFYDPNQNKYYKMNGNIFATKPSAMQNGNDGNGSVGPQHHHHNHIINNGNGNGNANNNGNVVGSSVIRERYQHPALVAIINEAQGIKFRGKHTCNKNFVM